MTTLDPTPPKGRCWQYARTAARDTKDRERLLDAAAAGWTALEFYEYARSCHRRRHADTPSAKSVRQALECHKRPEALLWREHFREHGSKPLPPRCPKELEYPPGPFGIGPGQRYWPWHSADHIARIDSRAREQFNIRDDVPVAPDRWGAAHHIYRQEIGLVAAPNAPKPRRKRKPRPHHAPHFQRDWPDHSDAFRAEIEARARLALQRRGLSPERAADSEITDGLFAYTCYSETKED